MLPLSPPNSYIESTTALNPQSVRRPTSNRIAAKVSKITGEIDCLNAALYSTRGAEALISLITARRAVHRLVLGHNELGDDGCTLLFKFLQSSEGRKYHISYISLNANDIGERGLWAIAEYLKHNQHLKHLFLQNNKLDGCASTFTTFVEAVNSSKLEHLSLSMNRRLSDSFIEVFLPALKCHHLCELYISGLGITARSCPHIVAYLSSSTRCRLRSFSCNGNAFGLRGVRSIIDAIQRHNYRIPTVELHANQLAVDDTDDDDETHNEPLQRKFEAWKISDDLLSRILTRNRLLRCETERQALRLLRYSRPVLLQASSPVHATLSSTEDLPFPRVPIEIREYILSLFAPTLSIAQRRRIFRYASTPSTLPPLLPRLSSSVTQVEDSRSVEEIYFRNTVGFWRREKASARWLRAIECDSYELEEGEEPDGKRVTWTIKMATSLWNAQGGVCLLP